MDKKAMLEWAKEHEDDIIQRQDMDDVARSINDFIWEFNLSFDVDCVDWSDYYLQSTVYVNRLFELNWHNVILDCDFESRYETAEEFVDTMLSADEYAKRLLSHFKN